MTKRLCQLKFLKLTNLKYNSSQQHLRKHGAVGGIRKVRSSWLSFSLADREVLRKAPRFLAAARYGQVKTYRTRKQWDF